MIKPSMHKAKGEVRFNLFRNKIVTRVDRSDPHWSQALEYDVPNHTKKSSIDFNAMEIRREN